MNAAERKGGRGRVATSWSRLRQRLVRVRCRDRGRLLVSSAAGLTVVPVVQADVLDLTSLGASGSINGVIFSTAASHSAGAGAVDPFVRIQQSGFESGSNTGVAPRMFGRNEIGGSFTHDITLAQIGTVSAHGAEYYQFFLDMNEVSGGDGSLLSLDDIRIYTSQTAHSDYKTNLADLGTLRYSMDAGADHRVELDFDLSPELQGPDGRHGTGDMVMLVPVALFAEVDSRSYVYLYSRFGEHNQAAGGFEEWWTRNQVIVPLPPSAWLGVGGLFAVAVFGALRRRSLAHEPGA